ILRPESAPEWSGRRAPGADSAPQWRAPRIPQLLVDGLTCGNVHRPFTARALITGLRHDSLRATDLDPSQESTWPNRTPGSGSRPQRLPPGRLPLPSKSTERLPESAAVTSQHDRTVRTEFRRQSPTFEGDDSFFAHPRLAAWVTRHLAPLDPSALVLEVACGAAHQGEAVAPYVGRVVGADLTPEMLAVARRRLRERAVAGVALARADAARLPFPDDSFDRTFGPF